MNLDPMRNDGAPSVLFQRSKKIKKTRVARFCHVCQGMIPIGACAVAITLKTTDDTAPFTRYCHDGKEGIDECRQRGARGNSR